jgi:hypothetical protein
MRADQRVALAAPGLAVAEPVWKWTASTVLRRHRGRRRWAAAVYRLQRRKLRKRVGLSRTSR